MDIKSIYIEDKNIERRQRIYAALTILTPLIVGMYALVNLGSYSHHLQVDVVLFSIFYLFTTLGISVGYHRLFTHKSFKPNRFVKNLLAIMGSMAAQGPVIFWAATHRRHHVFSDKEGDVHSPHLSKNRFIGLFYAHMGWMLKSKVTNPVKFCKDLLKDRDVLLINKYYYFIVFIGLVVPGLATYAVYGSFASFLEGIIWGGFIRMFVVHHITWALNSIAHVFGRQDYQTGDFSRNIPILSVVSMGESWHNNHHAFPNSALFGVKGGQPDPGYWLIKAFERFGAASSVRVPSKENIAIIKRKLK